jgi:hypothetical protein
MPCDHAGQVAEAVDYDAAPAPGSAVAISDVSSTWDTCTLRRSQAIGIVNAYGRTTAGESASAMNRPGFPEPSVATTHTSPPSP